MEQELPTTEQELRKSVPELTGREQCREAGYSLRETAAELNRNGLTTRAGQPWRFEYHPVRLPAAFDALVSGH